MKSECPRKHFWAQDFLGNLSAPLGGDTEPATTWEVTNQEQISSLLAAIDAGTSSFSPFISIHINSTRGGLEPVGSIGELQTRLQGKWITQINEHFNGAPSLLGLECIQLAASINNDHVMSEEGLVLWKKYFQEKLVDNKTDFSTRIPISWFNFIV